MRVWQNREQKTESRTVTQRKAAVNRRTPGASRRCVWSVVPLAPLFSAFFGVFAFWWSKPARLNLHLSLFKAVQAHSRPPGGYIYACLKKAQKRQQTGPKTSQLTLSFRYQNATFLSRE